MKERLEAWGRRLRVDPRTARDAAVAAVLCVVLVIVGAAGWRSGAEQRRRGDDLRQTLAATRGWPERFRAAASAESAAWLGSAEAVRELGVESADRIALLQLISRRAADVGLPDARITLTAGRGEVGRDEVEWGVTAADYGVFVQLRGDYWSVVALLGALPPMVEVRQVDLVRDAGVLIAELDLTVYRAAGPEAAAFPGPRRRSATEWTALAPYLGPVAGSTPAFAAADESGAVRRGRDPFMAAVPQRAPRIAPPAATRPPEPGGSWSVSAILITGERRVAVIDERVVAPGDTLDGGARVTAIERDHVVVRDGRGRVRQLTVNRRGGT